MNFVRIAATLTSVLPEALLHYAAPTLDSGRQLLDGNEVDDTSERLLLRKGEGRANDPER